MDPASIIGLASACANLVVYAATVVHAIESLGTADRAITSLATTLRVFGASIEQLQTWLQVTQRVSGNLHSAIGSSLFDCTTICADLEQHIKQVRPAERRMGIVGRFRHVWSSNSLSEQEGRLSTQLQTIMLLANLVKLNDAALQDSRMTLLETVTILERSALAASSIRLANDDASTVLSAAGPSETGLDRQLSVDEVLIRSGPYVSHYRDMVNRQRGSERRREARESSNGQAPPGEAATISPSAAVLDPEPDPGLKDVPEVAVPQPPSRSKPQASQLSTAPRMTRLSMIFQDALWKTSPGGRALANHLCQAAKDGNVKWAERLLQAGAYINGYETTESTGAQGQTGSKPSKSTPLMLAVRAGHLETTRWFINHGADVNRANWENATPIWYAVQRDIIRGDEEGAVFTRLLLGSGAFAGGVLAVHALIFAIRRDSVGLVRLLLENGANPDGNAPLQKVAPLSLAISRRCPGTVKLLLKHGANANLVSSVLLREGGEVLRNFSPIHIAALEFDEVIPSLLENGARVDPICVYEADKFSEQRVTALHLVSTDETSISRTTLISHGADVFAEDEHGRTPLFWAVGPPTSLGSLADYIAHGSPVNLKESTGGTVLHHLASHARELTESARTDLSQEELTALADKWETAVGMLLKARADPHLKDSKGETFFSISGKSEEYLKALQERQDARKGS